MTTVTSDLPLAGLQVLDLTRVLAGPLCTMMLGDLGANVIKVERLGAGDDTRGWGPPFDARGESAYYLSINRNKLSIAADLTVAADREMVAELMLEADVVVDNFRRGTLARHGLDPDQARAVRPELVWCTITGFGPESQRLGYDFVVQAESGWMAITGEAGGEPMKVGVALADVVTGKDATIAILGALVRRFRTGEGGLVTVSLAHSARAALVNVAQNVLVTGRDAGRWGNAHPNLVPYQLFDAADRAVVIAVGNDAQWRECARALELSDLAHDDRFATNAGRVAHRAALVDAVARRVRERPAAEWLTALERAGVPCGLVKGVLESLREVNASALTGVASPVGGVVRLPPPALDEHGVRVRREGWKVFQSLGRT
ncbi:MAG TPA: CoA transferase [Gemmatimonadaceae bacterium]|nr:CoA transferase [Gemmatimonadaceae bacterium]